MQDKVPKQPLITRMRGSVGINELRSHEDPEIILKHTATYREAVLRSFKTHGYYEERSGCWKIAACSTALSERVIIRNPDLKRRYLALWEWLCDARAYPQQVKLSLAQITTGRTTQRIIAFAEGKSLFSLRTHNLYI
jgi:hypothetical protein